MSFLKLYLFQAALPNGVTKILLIWTWKCFDIDEPVKSNGNISEPLPWAARRISYNEKQHLTAW